MKTPRRSFLTLLGGTLASAAARALAADDADAGTQLDPLFSGAPAPDDPLELLYSRRLSFDEGQPLITVRVAEGRQQIAFAPRGPLTVLARTLQGETHEAVTAGAQGRWTLQLLESAPGVGAAWVELEQVPFENKTALQRSRDEWTAKGVPVRIGA